MPLPPRSLKSQKNNSCKACVPMFEVFVDKHGQVAGDAITRSCWSSGSSWLLMKALLLGLPAVKKTSKKASLRRLIFTMEQLGVVAGNFALSFSLIFLSIFVQISGSGH